jgi:hypothetical protein
MPQGVGRCSRLRPTSCGQQAGSRNQRSGSVSYEEDFVTRVFVVGVLVRQVFLSLLHKVVLVCSDDGFPTRAVQVPLHWYPKLSRKVAFDLSHSNRPFSYPGSVGVFPSS